jgi:acyl carrier protein
MPQIERAAVATRVRAVIAEQFGEQETALPADVRLVDAIPGLDSLAMMRLITAIEKEFGFEVDFVGDDVRYIFATIDRMTDYIGDLLEDML